MLERCSVRPETLGRIRSSWMGEATEQYAAWLCDRGYREGTLATRVSLLVRFGKFAQTHGAQRYGDLPAHIEPFLVFWFQRNVLYVILAISVVAFAPMIMLDMEASARATGGRFYAALAALALLLGLDKLAGRRREDAALSLLVLLLAAIILIGPAFKLP